MLRNGNTYNPVDIEVFPGIIKRDAHGNERYYSGKYRDRACSYGKVTCVLSTCCSNAKGPGCYCL